MNKMLYRVLLTVAASGALGVFATAIIASGDNSYTAGFIVLPILFLELLVCAILFVIGIVLIVKDNLAGFYFLLAVLLLPSATVGTSVLAKRFEIGAYRVEPMVPIVPPIANKIVFKKMVTDAEVQEFWHEVLSYPHESGKGTMSLPGIQSIGTNPPENGQETLVFSYFSEATEEQRSFVRDRIQSSPKVLQLMENVDTTPETIPNREMDALETDTNRRKDSKVVISN
jgi:hypothetical protein